MDRKTDYDQPPASEDAQPVPFAYIERSAFIKLSKGRKDIVYGGVRMTMPGLARKKDSLVALYTHPVLLDILEENAALTELYELTGRQCDGWKTRATEAERKLAEAVEALEAAKPLAMKYAPLSVAPKINKALATLQAEQKGGA